jgi:hypothetical protein
VPVARGFRNRLYIFNHIEYDSGTLAEEYFRDVEGGTPIKPPANYFPDDDPDNKPLNRWRSHAFLLFGNWINQVYQTTPFDLSKRSGKTGWHCRPREKTMTAGRNTADREAEWRGLWTAYLEFYESSVPEEVYQNAGSFAAHVAGEASFYEPRGMLALVDGKPCGLVHYMYHRHGWKVRMSAICRTSMPRPRCVAPGSAGR